MIKSIKFKCSGNFQSSPNISSIFIFLVLISLFAACQKEKVIFEKNYDLKNDQWAYTDTLDYTFSIVDTMAIYDIILDITHTPQYPMQNVYLNIYTKFPTGERLKQLLNIDLADNTGKWQGECSSNKCTLSIPIQSNAFFNENGQYTITLEQYMREENLNGLKSMSLKLVDKQLKRKVK